jgi:hypothetical protein
MITIGSNYLDAEPSKNSGSKTTWPPSPKTTKVLGTKREAKDSKTAKTVHLVPNDPRIAVVTAVVTVVGTVAEEIAVEIAVAVMGSDAEAAAAVVVAAEVAAVAEEVAVAAEVAVAVDAVQTAATVDKTSLERRNSSKLRAIRDPFLNGLFCPLKLRL